MDDHLYYYPPSLHTRNVHKHAPASSRSLPMSTMVILLFFQKSMAPHLAW